MLSLVDRAARRRAVLALEAKRNRHQTLRVLESALLFCAYRSRKGGPESPFWLLKRCAFEMTPAGYRYPAQFVITHLLSV